MDEIVVICGSRYRDAPITVGLQVSSMVVQILKGLPEGTHVITGGAPGVDTWVETQAKHMPHLSSEVMTAEWDVHGKRAGILRNLAMLDRQPSRVMAIWDGESRGTAHMIAETVKRRIPLYVITISAKTQRRIMEVPV